MKKLFYLLFFLMGVVSVSAALPIGVQRLIAYETALALSITFLAAFLAGIVSFTSPCGFVLLPTFFSYAFKEKKKALAMTSFFSVGLLVGFVVVGVIAGLLGNFFNGYKTIFSILAGLLMILLGILSFLNKSFGFNLKVGEKKSAVSLILFGFLFAFAWTPCTFTVLSGILLLASLSGSLIKAALMLLSFGLGVVVPLLFFSYFSDKIDLASKLQGKVREFRVFNHKVITNTYNIVAGLILIILGVLIVLFQGTQFFQIYLPSYIPGNPDLAEPLNQKFLTGFFASSLGNYLGLALVLVVLIVIIYFVRKSLKENFF